MRWIAGTGLRWYYRDIKVVGSERIPRSGPVILAANHPNALVDALVATSVVPRRIRLTGKATLFENPFLAALLGAAGVVPLRRMSDERKRLAGAPQAPPSGEHPAAVTRNTESFRALGDVLAAGGAILIFPEGRSHSEPSLAPLKTGVARIAIEARDARKVRGLLIAPIGLVFERKERPRTRVLVQVGPTISVDEFLESRTAGGEVEALTARVEAGLRDVTLNFASPAHAARVLSVADVISGVLEEPRALGDAEPSFLTVLDAVRRIETARVSLDSGHPGPVTDARVAAFLGRLDAFRAMLRELRLAVSDVRIDIDVRAGAKFAVREGAILAIVGPAALWGRVNHFLPLRAARAIAVRGATDPDQPAMRTLVAGLVLVLVAYAAQTAAVAGLAGGWIALAYLVTLPVFASWDLRLADRSRRAIARVRAFLLFRRRPELREALLGEIDWLRTEADSLETVVTRAEGEVARPGPSARPPAALRSAGP